MNVARSTGIVLLAAAAVFAAACGGASDDASSEASTAVTTATPVDYSDRGPFAVGEVDLVVDADHQIAVFYPVDHDDVAQDAVAYSYNGDEILGPEVADLLPGALAGEIAPPDTWVEAPASHEGPFPLVMHSHGAAGNLRFANLHNSHVASWGYVVAAVDHPERGVATAITSALGGGGGAGGQAPACQPRDQGDQFLDSDQLAAGLDRLIDESGNASSVLESTVDPERIAAEGHSAGGSASGTLAYDGRVDAWLGQAPGAPLEPGSDPSGFATVTANPDGSCDFAFDTAGYLADTIPPPVPSLIIAAQGDTVIPLDRVETIYDWLDAPKRLVVIAHSGHAVFVDPCQPIQAQGGLSDFVAALGLDPDRVPLIELGENGCQPSDTPAETVWALIDHATVAQLNEVFDIDRAAAVASLDPDYLRETFPDRFLREQSAS